MCVFERTHTHAYTHRQNYIYILLKSLTINNSFCNRIADQHNSPKNHQESWTGEDVIQEVVGGRRGGERRWRDRRRRWWGEYTNRTVLGEKRVCVVKIIYDIIYYYKHNTIGYTLYYYWNLLMDIYNIIIIWII